MTLRAGRMLLAATVLSLAVPACTDLGVEPKSTVTESNIFNDPGSYRAFLAKLYAGLSITGQLGTREGYGNRDIESISDEGFSGYLRLFWNLQQLPTDEAIIGWGDGAIQELNMQTWSANNEFVRGMYARVFFQVGLANEFLRQTTDAKLSERGVGTQLRDEIQTYRAEARFLRALSYYHGLDLFANIPLVDENFPKGSTAPEQATRAQIFEFVESELNDIRDDLPPSNNSSFYGRASTAAADMLLAHLYINAEVYTGASRAADARAAAERVIAAGYALDDDWEDIFLADNHTSPEIIFAIPADGLRQRSYGNLTTIIHASVGGSMNPADFGVNGGWWGLRVRPEFVSIMGGADNADARSTVLWTEGQQLQIASVGDFTHGYGAPKFRNVTSSGEAGKHPEFVDTDFPLFRLADAYLIYAEAFERGGGGSEALAVQYVNALRERAFGDASGNITAAQLDLDFIIDERARELFWEAKRRTDLIRFGLFTGDAYIWAWKGGEPGGIATDDRFDLYPIPASELIANPNLTQNDPDY